MHQRFFKTVRLQYRKGESEREGQTAPQPHGKKNAYLQVKIYLRYHNRILVQILNTYLLYFRPYTCKYILTVTVYNNQKWTTKNYAINVSAPTIP